MGGHRRLKGEGLALPESVMKIDIHAHYRGPFDRLEAHMQRDIASGVDRVVIFSPRLEDEVLAAAEKYPDHYIPFYWVDWESDTVETAAERKARGFVGAKLINPPANYDEERFFSIYEGLEKAGMIALFHSALSSRSRPAHFQRICKAFPELTVVGAHIGNPWYREAAVLLHWHKNLHFDTSTCQLAYDRPDWLAEGPPIGVKPIIRELYLSGLLDPNRLIYGSDQFLPDPGRSVTDYSIERHEVAFDALGLSSEHRDCIYRHNAARILRAAGCEVD